MEKPHGVRWTYGGGLDDMTTRLTGQLMDLRRSAKRIICKDDRLGHVLGGRCFFFRMSAYMSRVVEDVSVSMMSACILPIGTGKQHQRAKTML
jgi:hypothetical protein